MWLYSKERNSTRSKTLCIRKCRRISVESDISVDFTSVMIKIRIWPMSPEIFTFFICAYEMKAEKEKTKHVLGEYY